MVDHISIQDKFAEFSAMYANRGIDDFDTFIRARVADFFINHEGASTDTIYMEIEEALCGPASKRTDSDCVHSVKEAADADGKNRHRKHLFQQSLKKNASIYIFGFIGVVIAGGVIRGVKCKKR